MFGYSLLGPKCLVLPTAVLESSAALCVLLFHHIFIFLYKIHRIFQSYVGASVYISSE